MSEPKLTYFDLPARAELTRLAFHAGNVPFDDNRISVEHFVFGQAKASMPFLQAPMLEVNGTKYAQSLAIARYAAKLSGIYPEDPEKALKVDMVVDAMGEILNNDIVIQFRTFDEKEKAEKIENLTKSMVPKYFRSIEKLVEGKFLLGDKLTLADLAIFDTVTNSLAATYGFSDLSEYPKIEAIVEGVKKHSNITAYLSKQ